MSNSNVLQEKLKIVLLGNSGVGKTNLMTRFLTDVLNDSETSLDSQMEIGTTHIKRKLQVDEVSFNLEIWDTSGDQKYDSMASMYCSGRTAVIICYDITNSLSFMKAKDWILQLTIRSCKIYMCATKKDLCNESNTPNPPLDSVQEYAETVKIKFFATSSYTGENVSELFHTIIRDFISAPWNKKEIKKQKRMRKKISFSFWNKISCMIGHGNTGLKNSQIKS